ncbi:unnamed protein product, partial [Rotaria sp. Silwood1]
MRSLINQTFIFVFLLSLVGSREVKKLKRSYIDECERFWQQAPVTWKHDVINGAKKLITVADAKQYISSLSEIWQIEGKHGANQFIATLKLNTEHVGIASSEYWDGHYAISGQNGEVTYIFVVIHSESSSISVTFSYHHLTENMIGSNSVYTPYAKDITIEWLKWKALENIQSMVPSNIAPTIEWS